MNLNTKVREPEMSFTEFLWKLVATVVFIAIIGIVVANHADDGSALQGYAHFVVGSCALVGLPAAIVAVLAHIWTYTPRGRRRSLEQKSG